MLMLWDILQRDLHGKELRVASVQKLMRNEELMNIYLILGCTGLPCCAWAFSICGEEGLLSVAELGLLVVLASAVELGL